MCLGLHNTQSLPHLQPRLADPACPHTASLSPLGLEDVINKTSAGHIDANVTTLYFFRWASKQTSTYRKSVFEKTEDIHTSVDNALTDIT